MWDDPVVGEHEDGPLSGHRGEKGWRSRLHWPTDLSLSLVRQRRRSTAAVSAGLRESTGG